MTSPFPERPAYDQGSRRMEAQRAPRGKAFAEQILRTCGPFLSKPIHQLDVLDLGCGYGHTALALARTCKSVVGIEPCSDLVEKAKELASSTQQSNLRFEKQPVESLDCVKAFDLIVLDNVFEHLPDQALALRKIEVALRPGGVLYMVMPNKLWPIEVHYHLPFLSWLPIRWANTYLRWTGRGTDYTDASYAPTLFRLTRLMNAQRNWNWKLIPPAELSLTTKGNVWYYRWGVVALKRIPWLWLVSKAFLVVARKKESHA